MSHGINSSSLRSSDRDSSAAPAALKLTFYRLKLVSFGEPRPLEGQGLGFFTDAEMLTLPAAPGLEAVRDRIAQCMKLGVFEPNGGSHMTMGSAT
jgi:hypothetical protein